MIDGGGGEFWSFKRLNFMSSVLPYISFILSSMRIFFSCCWLINNETVLIRGWIKYVYIFLDILINTCSYGKITLYIRTSTLNNSKDLESYLNKQRKSLKKHIIFQHYNSTLYLEFEIKKLLFYLIFFFFLHISLDFWFIGCNINDSDINAKAGPIPLNPTALVIASPLGMSHDGTLRTVQQGSSQSSGSVRALFNLLRRS